MSGHFAAATGAGLAYQVGALLAVLGGHRDTRSLRVLADLTRWIREGFAGLGLQNQAMIVCGYHVTKRDQPCLSRAGRGRDHRRQVEAPVYEALWPGRGGEAIAALRWRAGEMKNARGVGDVDWLPGSPAALPGG